MYTRSQSRHDHFIKYVFIHKLYVGILGSWWSIWIMYLVFYSLWLTHSNTTTAYWTAVMWPYSLSPWARLDYQAGSCSRAPDPPRFTHIFCGHLIHCRFVCDCAPIGPAYYSISIPISISLSWRVLCHLVSIPSLFFVLSWCILLYSSFEFVRLKVTHNAQSTVTSFIQSDIVFMLAGFFLGVGLMWFCCVPTNQ